MYPSPPYRCGNNDTGVPGKGKVVAGSVGVELLVVNGVVKITDLEPTGLSEKGVVRLGNGNGSDELRGVDDTAVKGGTGRREETESEELFLGTREVFSESPGVQLNLVVDEVDAGSVESLTSEDGSGGGDVGTQDCLNGTQP